MAGAVVSTDHVDAVAVAADLGVQLALVLVPALRHSALPRAAADTVLVGGGQVVANL